MHGKMLAKRHREAFSLVEIIIVITIMAIVIGVVGSLLAGYTRMFNETDDQAVARRRAQDVFNALEVPIINCALGIPTDTMAYFDISGVKAPIANWSAPLEIKRAGGSYASVMPAGTSGDVLRLAYSVPSGVKNGLNGNAEFSGAPIGSPPTSISTATLELTGPLSPDQVALTGVATDTRKFVTFPGAFMSPLKVTGITGNRINVSGKKQPKPPSTAIQFVRGEIPSYQDIQLVRAIAAYVDDQSVFHAAEVNATDITATNPGAGGAAFRNPAGLRVEGIKAVWYQTDAARKLLTVRVLAEGDIVDQTRLVDTVTRDRLKSRWGGITLDDRMYYEDFVMTWRIRNYVPN